MPMLNKRLAVVDRISRLVGRNYCTESTTLRKRHWDKTGTSMD